MKTRTEEIEELLTTTNAMIGYYYEHRNLMAMMEEIRKRVKLEIELAKIGG